MPIPGSNECRQVQTCPAIRSTRSIGSTSSRSGTMACPRVIAGPRATGLPLVAAVDAPAAIARLYLDFALSSPSSGSSRALVGCKRGLFRLAMICHAAPIYIELLMAPCVLGILGRRLIALLQGARPRPIDLTSLRKARCCNDG